MDERSGRLDVPGGQVWYRVAGAGPCVPVLLVHGGPGAGHDYLEPLEGLAREGRPVVFWDQLGCGRSEAPDDPGLYTLERLVEEVAAVREELAPDHVHLLGQSLGGWLAIEYLLRDPAGVASVHLASTSACMATLLEGMAGLRAALPEGAGEEEFNRRHVCREDPLPDPLVRTIDNTGRSPAHAAMWGPSQFEPTGNLRGWDRRADLGRVRRPALVSCGRYDKFVPACSEELCAGLPGSRLHVFERSSHMSHLEETERFLEVTAGFLDRVEREAQLT
jgi:pimeloyl-ACP methyl ester carboxylesterase